MKYRRSLFHILYFSYSNPLYFHSPLCCLHLLSAGTYPIFCSLRKPNTMTGVEGIADTAHWAASANGDERRSRTHIMFPPSTLSRSLRAAALVFLCTLFLTVLLNMVWDSSVLGTVPGRPLKSGVGASHGGMQSLLAHAQGPPTDHPSESLIRSILGIVNNDIRRRSSLTDEGTMEKGHANNGKMPSTYATPFSREMLRASHSRHEQEHSVSNKDVLQNLARAPMSEERKIHRGRSGKLAKLLSSWLDQIKQPAKMSKQLLRLRPQRATSTATQVPQGVNPLNVSGVCKKLLDGRWGFRTACAKSDCDQLQSDVGCKVNVEKFVCMHAYKDPLKSSYPLVVDDRTDCR